MENRPLIGVATCIFKDGQVLLGLRKGKHANNTWGFPGGHLEFGEKIEDCARREIAEEVDVEVNCLSFISVVGNVYEEENKHYLTILYTANYVSGDLTVKEPDKHLEWKWFPICDLPENLMPPAKKFLKELSKDTLCSVIIE